MNRLLAAEQLRRALQLFTATLTEDKALEIASVYPSWAAQTYYKKGDIISHGINPVGDPQLYKVVQAHTSQETWAPGDNPALYEPFGLDENGHAIWAQPSGAHDAYNIGDVVNYKGTLYESLVAGNVWAPDVYPTGWQEVGGTVDPGPDPGPSTYPEWVQPTGAHDAYNTGDIVSYNGVLYRSKIDGNTWAPDAYPDGWEVVE